MTPDALFRILYRPFTSPTTGRLLQVSIIRAMRGSSTSATAACTTATLSLVLIMFVQLEADSDWLFGSLIIWAVVNK